MAPPPFAVADDLEAIEEKAYAQLGREPDDTVHLIDSERRLVRMLSIDNRKLHESIERFARWLAIGWVLLVFCLIIFAVTAFTGHSPMAGLGLFVFLGLVYLGIVLTGIQNEVEGAVYCFILLVMMFLLSPAIQQFREQNDESSAVSQTRDLTAHVVRFPNCEAGT